MKKQQTSLSYEQLLEQLRQSRGCLVFVYDGELQTPPIIKTPLSLFFGPNEAHCVQIDVGFTDTAIIVSNGKTYFQLMNAELAQSLRRPRPNLEQVLITGTPHPSTSFLTEALKEVGLLKVTYEIFDNNNQKLPFKLEWLSINGVPYII